MIVFECEPESRVSGAASVHTTLTACSASVCPEGEGVPEPDERLLSTFPPVLIY